MKKIVLCFFLLATISGTAQTWVYHPFPDSAAVWNISSYVTCFPIFSYSEEYSIVITGDTLINTKPYRKLTTPFVFTSYDTTFCGGTYIGYKGSIRDDTANKKVYFVFPSDTSEYLLYNFTMQIGDTIKGITSGYNDTVMSIDSVLIGSNYHKRWNINQEYSISLIEGVGSTYGLIQPSPGYSIGTFPYYAISCFTQSGSTLYPNATTNCQTITSLNSIDAQNEQIKLYPNPAVSELNIETRKDFNIEIYNLLGEIIYSLKISNQLTKIDISSFKKGIYFVSINNGVTQGWQKFIKE